MNHNILPKKKSSMCMLMVMLTLLIFSSVACDEELLAALEKYGPNVTIAEVRAIAEEIATRKGITATSLEQQVQALDKMGSESEPCPALVQGPTRGLACLHCNERSAQGQARVLTAILRESCLSDLAINYLVDGSFGYDPAFMLEQIHLLTSQGRRLHLYFYITNGPSQRRWATTPVKGFMTNTAPESFRSRIKNDEGVRSAYQALVSRLMPVLAYAASRNAEITLVPMLEDNLDNSSFDEMLALAKEVVPVSLKVNFGRNPCPRCYPGNQDGTPEGMLSEVHTANTDFTSMNFLVSNDGIDFAWPSSEAGGVVLTLDQLIPARDKAADLNIPFILWSGKRQGLVFKPSGADAPLASTDRSYGMPSMQERRAIVRFLQGLPLE